MSIQITSQGWDDAANDARDDAKKITEAAKTNVRLSSLIVTGKLMVSL